jgi:glycine cleavage system regulatory protein
MVLANPSGVSVVNHAVRDEVIARAAAKGTSRAVVEALLDDAPEPWWESTSVAGLATDIVLLAPGLATDEVRIRIVSGISDWELSVVAADRPGLLATTAGVLAEHGLSIDDARIATWTGHRLGLQRLRVSARTLPSSGEPDFPFVGQALRAALAVDRVRADATAFPDGCAVRSVVAMGHGRWRVEVEARDEVGLLARIAAALHGLGANVLAADVHSEGARALDTFLVELDDEASLRLLRALATSTC